MVFIFFSLMTNGVEHHLICSLAICVIPLGKCLFKSFVHFLSELFIFSLLSCKSTLHILGTIPLSDTRSANIGQKTFLNKGIPKLLLKFLDVPCES